MNILITDSEGPDAVGLKVLRMAAQQYWRDAKITTVVPKRANPWGSMSMRHAALEEVQKEDLERLEPGFFVVDGCSASDVIDLAFLHQDWFGPTKKSFDIVLSGVSTGNVLGTDVFRNGNTAACMYAAMAYNCSAFSFAQDMATHDKTSNLPIEFYRTSQIIIPDYLRTSNTVSGECWIINCPQGTPVGYKSVPTAHYSHRRMPPLTVVPRAREENTDVSELAKGYVSCSLMGLRASQSLKY